MGTRFKKNWHNLLVDDLLFEEEVFMVEDDFTVHVFHEDPESLGVTVNLQLDDSQFNSMAPEEFDYSLKLTNFKLISTINNLPSCL